jgi:hypothetical protein
LEVQSSSHLCNCEVGDVGGKDKRGVGKRRRRRRKRGGGGGEAVSAFLLRFLRWNPKYTNNSNSNSTASKTEITFT